MARVEIPSRRKLSLFAGRDGEKRNGPSLALDQLYARQQLSRQVLGPTYQLATPCSFPVRRKGAGLASSKPS